MPLPIQLLDYVPEDFHFEVNPAYRLDSEHAQTLAEEGEEASISIDVDWSDPEVPSTTEGEEEEGATDEVLFFNLTVYVNDEDDFGEQNFYRLRLRLSGLFQRSAPNELFDDEEDGSDYLLHTLSSCISMLYGTARSEIASITSQAPYGKFILPPVSSVQVARSVLKENIDEAEETEIPEADEEA